MRLAAAEKLARMLRDAEQVKEPCICGKPDAQAYADIEEAPDAITVIHLCAECERKLRLAWSGLSYETDSDELSEGQVIMHFISEIRQERMRVEQG